MFLETLQQPLSPQFSLSYIPLIPVLLAQLLPQPVQQLVPQLHGPQLQVVLLL